MQFFTSISGNRVLLLHYVIFKEKNKIENLRNPLCSFLIVFDEEPWRDCSSTEKL